MQHKILLEWFYGGLRTGRRHVCRFLIFLRGLTTPRGLTKSARNVTFIDENPTDFPPVGPARQWMM